MSLSKPAVVPFEAPAFAPSDASLDGGDGGDDGDDGDGLSTQTIKPAPHRGDKTGTWRVLEPIYTDDGVPLHLRHWGAGEQAVGTVLIVHGLGEHIARYETLAADLNAAGWHAMGFDLRGHGASGGERGRIPRDDSLLRDVGRLVAQVRETRVGPVVLLGHSLGGNVAARYVAHAMADPTHAPSWHRRVDGLVLSSPALDLGMSATQRALLRVLERVAPDWPTSNRLDPTWLSRNEAVVKAYRSDPLVHDRVTARVVRSLIDGAQFVQQRASVWSLPTLLMWAGDDRCVVSEGSAAFAAAAPTDVVSSQGFAGLAHEIFNEPERERPVALLQRWLHARYAA
jgi:alpha-beta hydrolase superfamily lysophospholipase